MVEFASTKGQLESLVPCLRLGEAMSKKKKASTSYNGGYKLGNQPLQLWAINSMRPRTRRQVTANNTAVKQPVLTCVMYTTAPRPCGA